MVKFFGNFINIKKWLKNKLKLFNIKFVKDKIGNINYLVN